MQTREATFLQFPLPPVIHMLSCLRILTETFAPLITPMLAAASLQLPLSPPTLLHVTFHNSSVRLRFITQLSIPAESCNNASVLPSRAAPEPPAQQPCWASPVSGAQPLHPAQLTGLPPHRPRRPLWPERPRACPPPTSPGAAHVELDDLPAPGASEASAVPRHLPRRLLQPAPAAAARRRNLGVGARRRSGGRRGVGGRRPRAGRCGQGRLRVRPGSAHGLPAAQAPAGRATSSGRAERAMATRQRSGRGRGGPKRREPMAEPSRLRTGGCPRACWGQVGGWAAQVSGAGRLRSRLTAGRYSPARRCVALPHSPAPAAASWSEGKEPRRRNSWLQCLKTNEQTNKK